MKNEETQKIFLSSNFQSVKTNLGDREIKPQVMEKHKQVHFGWERMNEDTYLFSKDTFHSFIRLVISTMVEKSDLEIGRPSCREGV